MPSRWEGLPNCVLESLALGTPVLSTKEVCSLLDFKTNIINKSITLYDNIESLSNNLLKLKRRSDYKKLKLRKHLLTEHMSTSAYQKIFNSIIEKVM